MFFTKGKAFFKQSGAFKGQSSFFESLLQRIVPVSFDLLAPLIFLNRNVSNGVNLSGEVGGGV